MADEFPYLYAPANARHWYLAQEGGEVVAIVGAMVWTVILGGAPVLLASVGSVATDEHYRRRGLATRLLHLAESSLREEGVRLLLISGDRPMYLRFGARPVGAVDWYELPKAFSKPRSFAVREIDPARDGAVVARLYRSRSTRFIRPLPLLQTMLSVQPLTQVDQGVKAAFLVYDGDRAVSYACVVHRPRLGREASQLAEWAGDPNGVLYGIDRLPNWPEAGMTIPVLPDDGDLRGALPGLRPTRRTPFPWLAKVVDGVGLGQDLNAVWAELSVDPPGIAPAGNGRYRVRRRGQAWDVDAGVLTRLIFGHDVPERPEALEDVWPSPAPWPAGLNFI